MSQKANRLRRRLALSEASQRRLVAALADFANHGLRCDLNPTIMFKRGADETESMVNVCVQYCNYLRQIDKSTRERAMQVLNGVFA